MSILLSTTNFLNAVSRVFCKKFNSTKELHDCIVELSQTEHGVGDFLNVAIEKSEAHKEELIFLYVIVKDIVLHENFFKDKRSLAEKVLQKEDGFLVSPILAKYSE
jgi:hypothetical protein